MPSASKADKNAASEASDPLRQAIVMVEHKIRNLEKRKAKLESYKESGKGKQLSRDILEAVAKYDEVIHQLDMSREYVKQFTAICNENDKLKKKAAKKEALERTAAEIGKVKQVLLIQDVLTNMGTDQAREDFLAGRNGAPTLTEEDLKFLDDLYCEVCPKHEGSVPFSTQVQKAAEYLLAIVDGRSKEVAGTTCAKLQVIVNSIQECGYFDQPVPGAVLEGEQEELVEEIQAVPQEVSQEDLSAPISSEPQVISQEVPMTQAPGLSSTIPKPAPMHPLLSNIVPVSQVESNIYNAQGFKPPNTNPPAPAPTIVPNQRPINDVASRMGGGNFTFFQDSELELADLTQGSQQVPPTGPPNAIPSRTFTNQNFNGRPGPTPMGFPPAPATNPYFVGGFQPQVPPHYTQDLIQGYAGAPQVQNVPQASAIPNNAIPIQNQLTSVDNSNLGFSQPPQHNPNAYSAQPNPPSTTQPAAPVQQSFPASAQPPATLEEPHLSAPSEVKDEEPPRQEWSTATDLDWADNKNEAEWSEWNPQGTDNGTKGSSKPRGDRPRNNYQGNKSGNGNRTSNYSNNRPPRNRERESNGSNGGSNYYNNNTTNGYQSRGDGQSRDNRENKDGSSYRRGPPPNRGPRPERADSRGDRPPPARDGAPRTNNSGPRPPRNSFRGTGGPRQDSYPVK